MYIKSAKFSDRNIKLTTKIVNLVKVETKSGKESK